MKQNASPLPASVATRVSSLANGEQLITSDRFVPHVSTVPANRGRTVGLHVREKVLAGMLEPSGAARAPCSGRCNGPGPAWSGI